MDNSEMKRKELLRDELLGIDLLLDKEYILFLGKPRSFTVITCDMSNPKEMNVKYWIERGRLIDALRDTSILYSPNDDIPYKISETYPHDFIETSAVGGIEKILPANGNWHRKRLHLKNHDHYLNLPITPLNPADHIIVSKKNEIILARQGSKELYKGRDPFADVYFMLDERLR